MYNFDKDPKKQQKNFFKHFWDFSDEQSKQVQGQFINQEVEMWQNQLEQKAQQFMEGEDVPDYMKEYYKSQQESGKPQTLMAQNLEYQQKIALEKQILESKILSKLPANAPQWMQGYHLEYYGGFFNKWQRYETQDQNTGESIPYWYNQDLQKSTWDNPLLILESLVINGIESDEITVVKDWESMHGTPFIAIQILGLKKKDKRALYLHRQNKRIFKENPIQVVKQPDSSALENNNPEQKIKASLINEKRDDNQSDVDGDDSDALNIEIEEENEQEPEQKEQELARSKSDDQDNQSLQQQQNEEENEDSYQYDDQMLDPNAYDEDEDELESKQSEEESEEEKENFSITQIKQQAQEKSQSKQQYVNEVDSDQQSSDDSFEETPEQIFIQSHQREIVQFKEMLKEKKVDVFNTNWMKELPKVIHDPRCRLIPTQYREMIFEEYIKNIDLDRQRKKLWQQNSTLKQQFNDTLQKLIIEKKLDQDSEFQHLNKLLAGQQFYDKLLREDKDFLYSEFNRTQQMLKIQTRENQVEKYQQLMIRLPRMMNLTAEITYKDVKKVIKDEPAYKEFKSKTMKQQIFEEFMLNEILSDVGQKRARLVAMGGHDDEVQKIDKKERKRLKLEEAQEKIKNDTRFNSQFLAQEQKFELFKEYMAEQFNKKRKDFRDLLDEHRYTINPFSSWETVKDLLSDDQRFKDFPEKNRFQTFESHKQFLDKKIKKDFVQFLTDSLTKMTILKYKNQEPFSDVIEELTEIFEHKDERFLAMGKYFQDERQTALVEEVKKVLQKQ
ncbi:transcription elongation regulator 1 isoform 2 [Stylonychia lemnae]|uniref:Transcription elongation regulator 1 isoform 2 n=1 Tax=Stylonychia lemnae TaxID=5949 RepID=A0A078AGF5_STYLE|nr:transcription elongation regulator 1 isoform 2 [Stylonychia lemnae]|eukprot:CDW79923.1 transcription elongation regulator 1 isoform 2 [Stylonychia lemnae]